MVLQRAPQQAIVWGYADSSNVTVTLRMNQRLYRTTSYLSTTAGFDENHWSIALDPQSEQGPFQLVATQTLRNGSSTSVSLDDVLFGDVWICSGQSNMELPVLQIFNASIEIENAGKYPKVRLLTVARSQSGQLEEELLGISLNWSVASPTSVGSPATSAVCWLYGRMIHTELPDQPPIGLIHTSWGGTDIEYWSPPWIFKECNISR